MTMSLRAVAIGSAALALAGCAATPQSDLSVPVTNRPQQMMYEVYAVRFATLPKFPKRSLIAGAPASDSLDIAMMVWLIRGAGRTILVDAGFYRDKFIRQWRPTEYMRPSDAVAQFGVQPSEVTDVIISHIHWDHADGAELFQNARVWLQKDEYEYYVSDSGTVKQRAIDPDVALMFYRIRTVGRLSLVEGDGKEILPGITVHTGGKHTFASQYVSVRTRSGTVVIASDNAYLYENLEKRRPISQTLDSVSNLAAQQRMMQLAASPRHIVPGHDMQVYVRFAEALAGGGIKGRVVRID
jgi:glyoxylase-like metal-dependent hydrolase (beta-lactamase superfamily II)